jgi:hypothetical protein
MSLLSLGAFFLLQELAGLARLHPLDVRCSPPGFGGSLATLPLLIDRKQASVVIVVP